MHVYPTIKYPQYCGDCFNKREEKDGFHCIVPSKSGDIIVDCWRWKYDIAYQRG